MATEAVLPVRAPAAVALAKVAIMPEQQPLLPSRSISYNQEVNADPEVSDKPLRWKDRTAEVLESPALHKTVITLARTSSLHVFRPFSNLSWVCLVTGSHRFGLCTCRFRIYISI